MQFSIMMQPYLSVAKFVWLISTAYTASEPKLNTKLSKYEASNYCRNKGTTLLAYSDITKSVQTPGYLYQLNDSQSAWIEDSAKFSRFLSWVGCFEVNGNDEHYGVFSINTKSLFRCQEKCDSDRVVYIGISYERCFCIYGKNPFRRVKPSLCNIKCSNYSFESCGGNNTMSLYNRKPYYSGSIQEFDPRQCMYLTFKNGEYRLMTSGCYTLNTKPIVRNYFCDATLNMDCDKQASSLCLIRHNRTWKDANEDCLQNEGQLAFYWASFPLDRAEDAAYWLGLFRTFSPSSFSHGDNKTCLAVTRVGHAFYIETDMCSTKKFSFCRETVLPTAAPRSSSRNITSPAILTELTSSLDLIRENKSNTDSKQAFNNDIILACAVQGAVFAFLLVLVGFCIIYRRRKQRRNLVSSHANIPKLELTDIQNESESHSRDDRMVNENRVDSDDSVHDYQTLDEHFYEEVPVGSDELGHTDGHSSEIFYENSADKPNYPDSYHKDPRLVHVQNERESDTFCDYLLPRSHNHSSELYENSADKSSYLDLDSCHQESADKSSYLDLNSYHQEPRLEHVQNERESDTSHDYLSPISHHQNLPSEPNVDQNICRTSSVADVNDYLQPVSNLQNMK